MTQIFDDIDQGICIERQKAFNRKEGPRVGDFVRFEDGKLARFTHDWEDTIQTTHPSDTGEGGQFYFGSGYCTYSGSLETGIKKADLISTTYSRQGNIWIFHHDRSAAHNGVYTKINFRVFDYVEGVSDYYPKKGGENQYIIKKDEAFKGHCQSVLLECNDGIFRVGYCSSKIKFKGRNVMQTWEEYQQERGDNFYVISSEQFGKRLEEHNKLMITARQKISEECYYEMMDCLPPSRLGTVDGVQIFHISERLTSNLVNWYGHDKAMDKYYTFVDFDDVPIEQIRNKFIGS